MIKNAMNLHRRVRDRCTTRDDKTDATRHVFESPDVLASHAHAPMQHYLTVNDHKTNTNTTTKNVNKTNVSFVAFLPVPFTYADRR